MSTYATLAVLERNLRVYRREWRLSMSGNFLLPTFFLLGIGIGVGHAVKDVGGFGYLQWMAPGLIASTAFQIAFSGSTYPVFNDVRTGRIYHAMAATPMRIRNIVGGWLLYSVIRVQIAVLAFLAVALIFHGIRSWWALTIPLITGLLAVATTASCAAFSAFIESEEHYHYLFRFVMIPCMLFCGVYFPVDRFDGTLRLVIYVMPLWHGVELARAAALGTSPTWPVWAHVGYLLLWSWSAWFVALRVFRKRLRT